jgi:hypothetical protein
VDPRVKMAYLRPYRLRTPDIGPPPARLSATPVSVEPDGSGWYQIEEILDHRGPATNNGECLVHWKDFDASHDSWIRRHSVTPLVCVLTRCFYQHMSCISSVSPITHATRPITHATRLTCRGLSLLRSTFDSLIGRDGNFFVLRRIRRPPAEIEVAPVVSFTGRGTSSTCPL